MCYLKSGKPIPPKRSVYGKSNNKPARPSPKHPSSINNNTRNMPQMPRGVMPRPMPMGRPPPPLPMSSGRPPPPLPMNSGRPPAPRPMMTGGMNSLLAEIQRGKKLKSVKTTTKSDGDNKKSNKKAVGGGGGGLMAQMLLTQQQMKSKRKKRKGGKRLTGIDF